MARASGDGNQDYLGNQSDGSDPGNLRSIGRASRSAPNGESGIRKSRVKLPGLERAGLSEP